MSTDNQKLFSGALVSDAIKESFTKLNPKAMIKNPVMFCVEIGTVIMLVVTVLSTFMQNDSLGLAGYNLLITFILFLTVIFANFAEAIAEGATLVRVGTAIFGTRN